MKKNNFIKKDEKGWYITKEGKRYKEHYLSLKNFTNPFEKKSPKDLILMFDVPIEKNTHRDWLRRQLKEFDYVMVQQSVWVGPSPLPKEFTNYMKRIGIKDKIKTFKLSKAYRPS